MQAGFELLQTNTVQRGELYSRNDVQTQPCQMALEHSDPNNYHLSLRDADEDLSFLSRVARASVGLDNPPPADIGSNSFRVII